MSKLLVVDDEQSICWGLTRLGESLGHEVVAASSAEQAFHEVERQRPDAVILDVRLPGMDGLTAIERFQKQLGSVPIIVITAYGDLRTAVEAVRRGAFDYIAKPFDVDKVKVALVRALVSGREKAVNTPAPLAVEGMVGRSPAMQEVYKRIALAAASDASVLLTGESGTGKELAARAIHRYSRRASGPFVAVNVAALTPLAAESELFGHVRGAFAGADEDRVGRLVQASGGTLFLDEVSEIPLPTQVKLLRALEHHEVVPVGARQAVPIDFRMISATRHRLIERANEARFRHDLLFRLGAFQIELPALGERREDIADLATYFIESLANGANEQAGAADGSDARRAGAAAVARQRPRAAARDRTRADHGPRPGDFAGASAAERAGRDAAGPGGRRRSCGGVGRAAVGGAVAGRCFAQRPRLRRAAGRDRAAAIGYGSAQAPGPMCRRGSDARHPPHHAPQEAHPARPG